MTGFIKKYGGTRLSLSDNVRTYPLCTCGKTMYPARNGYTCGCGLTARDEQLKGRTWVTANGTVILQGTGETL